MAIDIPEEAKPGISRIIRPLKTEFGNVRWVKNENLHITVKFFGRLEAAAAEKLIAVISASVSNFGAFTFSLQGLGFFGRSEYPRVIWLGIGEGREKIEVLNGIIKESAAEYTDLRDEDNFSPHLTLGRCGKRAPGFSSALAGSAKTPVAFVDCKMLIFYSGKLTGEGPVYEKLAEIKL